MVRARRLVRTAGRTARGSAVRAVLRFRAGETGMSTAEYAIGTVAVCAFAAVLYRVITSTQVLDLLSGVVTRALHVPF
jgi:uncharacterized membrane protein YdjX (TVP38/TMEM64 family)